MNLLLDTQIFIWLTAAPQQVPPAFLRAIDGADRIVVSAATVWEIAIKVRTGKLDFPVEKLLAQVDAINAVLLDMTARHALAAGGLPLIHADPFDRMLVAQAQTEGLTLATVDRIIPQYDVAVLART